MSLRPHTLALLSLLAVSSAKAEPRPWTNAQGKQVQAEFGGMKDGNVTLIMSGGQTATVALASLSAEDQAWVRQNTTNTPKPAASTADPADAARIPWDKRRMPSEVKEPMLYMNIKVVKEEPGSCIYESGHFQFKTSAKLGAILMKDVCRAFESTYELVRLMPWGIIPKPEEGRAKFQAELYASRDQYLATGAPPWSGGVYVRPDKVFRMPFNELGISNTVGANGAYYRKGEINNDTITHEITHQMMHEYLPYMPVWLIEGLAEYTSNLAYKGGMFSVSGDGTSFLAKQPGSRNRGLMSAMRYKPQWIGVKEVWGYTTDISTRHEIKSFKVADHEEQRARPAGPPPSMEDLANRYHSSHILAYFFVHDDGGRRLMRYFDALHEEKKKWPAFWDQVDAYNAELKKLRPLYDAYRSAMKEFMQQPGVKDLGGGRFSYPKGLTPPTPPPSPPKDPQPPDDTDPDAVCAKHLGILLNDRSLEQIEQEVRAMFLKNGFSL
ncbi:SHD1 domain-containing protein [Prosthecobacter sp.]|uniref:SHD1 domain-containing protein n=1 Tax=Prosthecobacter sp. TaxID=1965333 RepID=UPI003784CD31